VIENDGVLANYQRDCLLCKCLGGDLHHGLRDVLFGAPGVWSIRQCTNPKCGLGWVDPQPLATEIGKLYEDYYTHSDADVSAQTSNWSLKSFVKLILGFAIAWRRPVFWTDLLHLQGLPPGRLLEVGCGSGAFLEAATKAGWSAIGTDVDQHAIESARRRYGVEAHVGELSEFQFESKSFDAVVMNNVIEHVSNPLNTIIECRRILRPGGRIVIITPNLNSYGHSLYGKHWRGLEIPRHLHIFTVSSLKLMARAARFRKITAFTSIGRSMFPACAEIAQRSGEWRPEYEPAQAARSALRYAITGRHRGEWAVLVAHA
jgi:2-polyprenyl-3-methyl-5-hydroxy-6-metoxy-1,4-benzoquinol methylase